MKTLAALLVAIAAVLGVAAPAHAADYPTEVTFESWIDGAHWDTMVPWYVQVTVRDTVVGQTLAGNGNCTTGAGTVHFSYTTSRGASGTMPDSCLDLHGKGSSTLPDSAMSALVPGDVVTISASFEATDAADYASSTTPATVRVTAIAIDTYIDLYDSDSYTATPTSIGLTAMLQPYGYEGPSDGPAGTWTVWVQRADGTEDGRVTHANVSTLEMVFEDLEPGTRYTATARFVVASADLGRRTSPPDELYSFTTAAAPAAAEAAPTPEPTVTAAAAAEEKIRVDAEEASATSPVLPIVAIALILLLAAAVTTLVILRSRRTIG